MAQTDATLLPIADTYATSSPYDTYNWGAISFVAVRNSTTAFSAVSYLKFDLTNVTAAPTSARLNLTTDTIYTGPANATMTVQVYSLTDNTWKEGGLTWNNAPGLNTTTGASTGTLITSKTVPLQKGASFSIDVTAFIAAHRGQIVTLQLVNPNQDGNLLDVNSKEASSGRLTLAINTAFTSHVRAPFWAENVVPKDSAAFDSGPSAADSVNLASGVEENNPGPDLVGRNPYGPSALFRRAYRSSLAADGYGSPGLSPGWYHNYDMLVQGTPGTWSALTLRIPNGAAETWSPALDSNNVPTGALYPANSMGTPYLINGVPSQTQIGQWLSLTVTFKDRSSWKFTPDPNILGNYLPTQISNLVGRSLFIHYDNSYRLTSVTDDSTPANTLLSFTYGGTYLSSATDPYGRQVVYTFAQAAGTTCLTGVSQLNSTSLEWQYDYTSLNGWPLLSYVSVPDPASTVASPPMRSHPITYYWDGRVATLGDANGNTRLYTYDTPGGTQVRVLDSGGALVDTWTQGSGSLNNAVSVTYASNNNPNVQSSATLSYDDGNNPFLPTQYTNRSQQTVSTAYDQYGNMLTVTRPVNGAFVSTHYTYDQTTFALGQVTTVRQDHRFGGLTYHYLPNGLVDTITLPGGSHVVYTYTALGNVKTKSIPASNKGGNTVTYIYEYQSDPYYGTQQAEVLGKPLTITDPMGGVTHYHYDVRGNCIQIVDAMLNAIDYRYNIADQLWSTVLPATNQTGSGRAHIDTIYQYPGGPALYTVSWDESGHNFRQVNVTSGNEGESLAQTGAAEQVGASYDGQARLKQLTDGNNHAMSHLYDLAGNMTQLTFPTGESIRREFDVDGNITVFHNARNQTLTNALAPDDSRLLTRTHSTGVVENYAYDSLGCTFRRI